MALKQRKFFATSVMVFATLLLITATANSQEAKGTAPNGTGDLGSLIDETSGSAATTTPAKLQSPQPPQSPQLLLSAMTKRHESVGSTAAPQASGADEWHFEIRPYLWLAGIYGRVRVNNRTAETGKSSASVLGMLDFAAAAQVEAIKGRWRIIIDENYVNLGTEGTGPLGNVTVDVQPTMNILEFGASYTFVKVENEDSTASEPLPPVFTAEVLGGGRFVHIGLGLQANNNPPEEASRNLIGPFFGNRLKVSPHKAVTMIGKYTVGGSGAGSNFAWSAEALLDLRLKKGFSVAGGYRWLGLNADQPTNRVGFDGTMRGLMLSLTFYR